MTIIGNCIDSFNENGDCINNSLPWQNCSEFACDVEEYGDNFVIGDVRVDYDSDNDVHTFTSISHS